MNKETIIKKINVAEDLKQHLFFCNKCNGVWNYGDGCPYCEEKK